MKILLINGNYNGGGAAKIAIELYEGLKKKDIDVSYMVGRGTVQNRDVKVICNNWFVKVIHALRRDIHGGVCYTNSYALNAIIEVVKKENVDIVHFHNIANNYFGLEDLQKLTKYCKVVWTLHEMWALTGHCGHAMDCDFWKTSECKKCPDIKRDIALKYNCAHTVWEKKKNAFVGKGIIFVTPSVWLKKMCMESYLRNERVEVINNGIELPNEVIKDKECIRKKYGIAKNANVMLFVAGKIYSEYKGFQYLQKAILCMEKTENYCLVMVGQGKPSIELTHKIKTYHFGRLADKEKLNEIYAMSDLLIVPSVAENFPTVAIEALSEGTPILAFNTGGIPEIIGSECGWIVDKYDIYSLKNKIIEIFNNKLENINKKSEKCKERANEMYSCNKMIQEYVNLYKRIMIERE